MTRTLKDKMRRQCTVKRSWEGTAWEVCMESERGFILGVPSLTFYRFTTFCTFHYFLPEAGDECNSILAKEEKKSRVISLKSSSGRLNSNMRLLCEFVDTEFFCVLRLSKSPHSQKNPR